jgi:hypothetical protein
MYRYTSEVKCHSTWVNLSSSNAHSLALAVQQAEQATEFSFSQLEEAGCIAHGVNVGPADTFLMIFFLIILGNMLIKIILQMLISVADTKLFKAKKNRE